MAGRLYIAPIDLQPLFPDLIVDQALITSHNLPPRQRLSAIRLEAGRPHLSRLFWGLTPPGSRYSIMRLTAPVPRHWNRGRCSTKPSRRGAA